MGRQRLLGQMDRAWSALQASYAGIDPAEMTTRIVTGEWSVKDILAHVTVWQREALKHLPLILAGGRPPKYSATYGGIDTFNALMSEQARQLPLAQVLDELESAHHQLLEYLAHVPDAELETDSRFRRRLRLDTYGHYAVHARMIQAWREEHAGSIEQGLAGRRASGPQRAPGADSVLSHEFPAWCHCRGRATQVAGRQPQEAPSPG